MIKIERVHIDNIVRAVYSARNAMNSWHKSDSDWENDTLGEADLSLAKSLCKAGTDHRKFMRMITVYIDITAPLYWWKEFDTYKVGTVANSCSTMHMIHAKEFTIDDFSHEHLFGPCYDYEELDSTDILQLTVNMLNLYREKFLDCTVSKYATSEECGKRKKEYWWQLIQLLPSSYNQKRTVMLSYEVLARMYKSRKNHKLDEWVDFCKWIESLPYSELITGSVEV